MGRGEPRRYNHLKSSSKPAGSSIQHLTYNKIDITEKQRIDALVANCELSGIFAVPTPEDVSTLHQALRIISTTRL